MPLHWMVPARRAVVTGAKLSYAEVLRDWVTQLRLHRPALERWYFSGGREQRGRAAEAAIQSLERYIAQTFATEPHAAAGDEPIEIHSPPSYHVRLWKGPFRVLLEEGQGRPVPVELPEAAPPPEDEALDDEVLDDELDPEYNLFGQPYRVAAEPVDEGDGSGDDPNAPPISATPGAALSPRVPSTSRARPERSELTLGNGQVARLLTDDLRQALPSGTDTFLPGDVLEMPLFKLVFPRAPLEFDPEGSFFLGTSLRAAGGGLPPRAPRLHDNLIAMRFQLLLSACRGAFHALTEVFKKPDREPQVRFSGGQVHARGILYGGSLGRGDKSASGWGLYTMNWGTGANVPARDAYNHLTAGSGKTLTPAGACSPTMGFLAAFMLNDRPGVWPADGVYHDFRARVNGGPMWRHWDLDLLRLVPGPPDAALDNAGDRIAEELHRRYLAAAPEPDASTAARTDRLVRRSYELLGIPYSAPVVEAETPPRQRQRNDSGVLAWDHGQSYFTPITVLALTHHTYALVRVAPAARLSRQGGDGEPPFKGFIAAYDPLGGAPAVDRPENTEAPWQEEQLYLFEASGALTRAEGRLVCGGHPYKWQPVVDNAVAWHRGDGQRTPTLTFDIPSRRAERPYTLAIARIRGESLDASVGDARRLAPLFFAHGRHADPPDNLAEWYATRAVPFPTMAEADASGHFPLLTEVPPRAQAAWNKIAADEAVAAEQRRIAQEQERLAAEQRRAAARAQRAARAPAPRRR